MISSISRDIVILGSVKIKQELFRWAPRSLISKKDKELINKRDESASATLKDLLATWYIYSLIKKVFINLINN